MKIIPAIDLISGKTVRLEQGRYDRELNYDIHPVDAAKKWQSMGAEMIHVIDLDGARKGEPSNLDVVEEILKVVSIPVEVGGGYRTEENIYGALDLGVSRVIIGSKAFTDMEFAKICIDKFDDKVILSADARNFEPMIEGWEKGTKMDLIETLKIIKSYGAKEIIYTDISRDGMLTGPSIGHLKKILEEVNINVISAGGIKTVEHVVQLKELEPLGLSGVIVGRALYDGTIDLKEAIDAG